MIDTREVLKNALQESLTKWYSNGELAYLALTSKIEHQVRDKVAWVISTKKGLGFIPSREWLRRDLVLINRDNLKAKVFIEFKSWYTFDCVYDRSSKQNSHIAEDFRKIKKVIKDNPSKIDEQPEICFITLAVHPHSPIKDASLYGNIIKYSSDINKCYKGCSWSDGYKDGRSLANHANEIFKSKLQHKEKVIEGSVPLGEAFNTKVSLLYWIYGPFTSSKYDLI